MEEENLAAELQETSGCAEESTVKSEEANEDVIYEIQEESENSEDSEDSENDENDENDDNADNADNAENADNDDNSANAENRLKEMVAEMGAETVLEIIRDNRNAAIRQILAEVEAQRAPLQSGVSAARACTSIFDLAALA